MMDSPKLPKLVLTDIDGVWTDGGMYYFENGVEGKRFNVRDGVGALLLNNMNVSWGILTGEENEMVVRRAEKLNCSIVRMGVEDKVRCAREIVEGMGILLKDVAFVGDEINDLGLLLEVGFSAAPSDACELVRESVDVVLKRKGGEGAFKEFVELLLFRAGCLDSARDLSSNGNCKT
jgi:YrbI family 3-deoxy-D-manno-octulosonate 8-phosphate phosphatase